jgi:hypothetical protein
MHRFWIFPVSSVTVNEKEQRDEKEQGFILVSGRFPYKVVSFYGLRGRTYHDWG